MPSKKIKNKIERWKKIELKLQTADIILARENKYYSSLVRKVTNSYWSHIMIVFFIQKKEIPFKNILVISAETGGIEIHRMHKYTEMLKSNKYDLGVKRVQGLSPEEKRKVLAYMLNNIDIPYDYLRLFAFLINYLKNLFRIKNKKQILNNFLINKNLFICSSFIQKAFFEAVLDDKKKKIIFSSKSNSSFFLEEVTPADIAKSKNCEWIYNPHN